MLTVYEEMDKAASFAAVVLKKKILSASKEELRSWKWIASWYRKYFLSAGFSRLTKKILLDYFDAENFRPIKTDEHWQVQMTHQANIAYRELLKKQRESNPILKRVIRDYADWQFQHYRDAGYKRLSIKLLDIFYHDRFGFYKVRDDEY